MADSFSIDLGPHGPVADSVSSYINAFKAGQELGKPIATQNGNPTDVTNPQPGIKAPVDVSTLKGQLDALPGPQHALALAAAQQKSEQTAHVLLGLKNYPPELRLEIAQHLAQQTGLLDPNSVTPDDVTDHGIDAHMASVLQIEQMLKLQEPRRQGMASERDQLVDPHHAEGAIGQMPMGTASKASTVPLLASSVRYIGQIGD